MNLKKYISDYVFIALGSLILSIAINMFFLPVKISTGGVSGIATVLYFVFSIPLSLTVFFVNVFLFILAFKKLPKESLIKTLVGVAFLSIFLELTSIFEFKCTDIFISSVFGGVLTGIGIGITIRKNASTGGSDFASLIIKKNFPHVSHASIIFAIDFAIVLISGIVFKNYYLSFYSFVSLYICSFVADKILTMGNFAKSVYIISEKSAQISDVILKDINRGVTGIYSKGIYKSTNGIMLMTVVRAKELPHLLEKIKEIDPLSFVTITDIREVRGAGF